MLLINPQRSREDQLGSFADYVPLNVPFSLGFLAGYMIKFGKKVHVIDEEVTPLTMEMLEEYVKGSEGPPIFGVTALTANFSHGLEIAGRIKERFKDGYVVFGGIHPTIMPDEVLKSGACDIVVRNEGEATMTVLYDILKSGGDYSHVPGISFMADGAPKHNEQGELVEMADVPVFPYHLFEGHKDRYNFGFLTTSRGCPYECIFCSQRSITGKSYRYSPVEIVVETLDLLINHYGQKALIFSDDNFVVGKKRVRELCAAIVEHGFHKKASFMCQVRGDSMNEEVLKHLKAANFTGLSFGIETASDRLMGILKKAETVQDNVDGITLARKHGFKVTGTFILGLPTETREERLAAYKLARSLKLDYVRFNNATPYPGTELYEIARREGRLNLGKDWTNLNACGTLTGGEMKDLAYVPTTCTQEELMSSVFWHNVFYSVRPVRIFKMLFDKSTDTAGWFAMPDLWYLKWKEWRNVPSNLMENKEFWDIFTSCLDGLPENHRRAFSLREIDGVKGDEICKILDITSTNLWVVLHRARSKLRDCLNAKWFGEGQS